MGIKKELENVGIDWFYIDIIKERFNAKKELLDEIEKSEYKELWYANPDIYNILKKEDDLEKARQKIFEYLAGVEVSFLDGEGNLYDLELSTVRHSIRTLRNIFAKVNEKKTGRSVLEILHSLAKGKGDAKPGFIAEFIHLFRGVLGLSGIYTKTGEFKKEEMPSFVFMHGRKASIARSEFLDKMKERIDGFLKRYKSGLDEDVIRVREENKKRILEAFGGSESDWYDYKWHLRKVIKDARRLAKVIKLSEEEEKAITLAEKEKIPFGITPYYAGLMDYEPHRKYDHAVRAQVIPPYFYVKYLADHKSEKSVLLDFMGEHDTSPHELITRRYPEIAIIKPVNTCSQICVYCQRNWEIDGLLDRTGFYTYKQIEMAISWFKKHPAIEDVLITGGDPFILSDKIIDKILNALSQLDHVRRIRIGTRIPVTLPFRITDNLCNILEKYIVPGKREIVVVTHFEHSYEVTPEAALAVRKLKKAGIPVYNQEVFTFENSRRFETVHLRKNLRAIGIDPYYTFFTKGKIETSYYMVPIARLLQERKEEARLLPGIDRTDEPVFNVPRLGKNHLRSWQDHDIIGIDDDGSRIYEFHPWEKYISKVPVFKYKDVSIYNYLMRLKNIGEDPSLYSKTIWYYF